MTWEVWGPRWGGCAGSLDPARNSKPEDSQISPSPQNLSPPLPHPSEAWEGAGRGPTSDPFTLTWLDSQAIPVPKSWEDR